MHVRKLSLNNAENWDNYVAQHPEATFYHRFAWKSVIEDSMAYPGTYLMALDNERIRGIYPFFILSTGLFGTLAVSLPYLNYGGILADSLEVEKLLIEEAKNVGRAASCRYIELRQRFPLKSELPISQRKAVSLISLHGGQEQVFSRLHQNVRNKIRKSTKNGVIVQRGVEYLSDFYDVYARNLRDMGTPVLSRKFFERMVEAFSQNVRVYRATHQGKTIGGKIVLIDRDTCYFVWVASVRDELRRAPVHALNWAAIEDACAAGCKQIDFGRSTAESTHQDFKKYWGVQSQILPWAYQLLNCDNIPELNKENPRLATFIAAWKKLPLFLSRLLGPPLARRLP
jgi:FemAB-related protein (PEP-CTERM system-associated)